jgi:hypothetical protein
MNDEQDTSMIGGKDAILNPLSRNEEDAFTTTTMERRTFLYFSAMAGLAFPFSVVTSTTAQISMRGGGQALRYRIFRPEDECFVELEAIGFEEFNSLGRKCLRRTKGSMGGMFVFELPPQHFLEHAIPVEERPVFLSETKLQAISLFPASRPQIVFEIPEEIREVDLTIETLMDWARFRPVFPDLDSFEAFQMSAIGSHERFTRIEMPWGLELSPRDSKSSKPLQWVSASSGIQSDEWNETWSALLVDQGSLSGPVDLEVLEAKGFVRKYIQGDPQQGNFVVRFGDDPMFIRPEKGELDWPLTKFSRLEIAASLSRRFPYTGSPGIGTGGAQTAVIEYENADGNVICTNACARSLRAVEVSQYRLTPHGGVLALDAGWDPDSGCALQTWKHRANLGRDNHVKLVTKGYLYPFGIEAALVIQTDRAFIQDEGKHFVAPLLKTAYIEIPRFGNIAIGHSESPFVSLRVTTERTPPLDIPKSGNLSEYEWRDYFVPMVDGEPFKFAHVGIDWADKQHYAEMPMIFVSNRARSSDGLIYEPNPDGRVNRISGQSCCDPDPGTPIQNNYMIPKSQGSEGLRVVDRLWNRMAARFAQYNYSSIALARPASEGDTNQSVEWVEWTRARVPDLPTSSIAERPFLPRARTLKIQPKGVSRFSGQRRAMLCTYRDTRFVQFPYLDPEPTTRQEQYDQNVASESYGLASRSAPYIHVLETVPLVGSQPPLGPDPAPLGRGTEDEQIELVRSLYYRLSNKSLPDSLFMNIDNEVQFGRQACADVLGGLAVPDTHVSYFTRETGMFGDSTFDPNQQEIPLRNDWWDRVRSTARLDYAALRRDRPDPIDVTPFEPSRNQALIDEVVQEAKLFMGISDNMIAQVSPLEQNGLPPLGLKLADLFGLEAEILPGILFTDIFQDIDLLQEPDTDQLAIAAGKSANPLKWNYKTTGIDWLIELIGEGPGQMSIQELITLTQREIRENAEGKPLELGIEATLDWSNKSFTESEFRFVKFLPRDGKTSFNVKAKAKSNLSLDLDGFDVNPGETSLVATAEFTDFDLTLFKAITAEFQKIRFEVSADGTRDFSVDFGGVSFPEGSPLEFVSKLSEILGSLGGDSGFDVSITPRRVKISQRIAFPPNQNYPLILGPAQISNLVLSWGVTIPILDRGTLTTGFGLASRSRPLTIYVPPWYGGKAHAYIEVSTRGIRLFEFSMEYGAIIPIVWGIARGEGSVMAGVFYMMEHRNALTTGDSNKNIQFRAFFKAMVQLSVAGIIDFSGVIYIGLQYDPVYKRIIGEASITVSIKIGFVRFTLSFAATHEEKGDSDSNTAHRSVRQSMQTCTISSISTDRSARNASGHESSFRLNPSESPHLLNQFLAGYNRRD